MTLPEFATKKNVLKGIKNTIESTEATFGRKRVWLEEIMVNCGVICGSDEKMEKVVLD